MPTTTLPIDHRPANAKLKSHGFLTIHSATIRIARRADKTSQPMILEVTGTWKAANSADPMTMRTKAVAAGTRIPLERFARVNNLPISKP